MVVVVPGRPVVDVVVGCVVVVSPAVVLVVDEAGGVVVVVDGCLVVVLDSVVVLVVVDSGPVDVSVSSPPPAATPIPRTSTAETAAATTAGRWLLAMCVCAPASSTGVRQHRTGTVADGGTTTDRGGRLRQFSGLGAGIRTRPGRGCRWSDPLTPRWCRCR